MQAAPVGVVASAFILLYGSHGATFTSGLSRKITAAPAIGLKIGGILNFLAERGLISAQGGCGAVTGIYPTNRPSAGYSWQTAAEAVRFSIQQLNMSANLNAAMTCVVGIQNDLLMLGFDKVIGAVEGTVKSTYSTVKSGKDAYDKYQTVNPAERIKQLQAAISSARGAPEEIFLTFA